MASGNPVLEKGKDRSGTTVRSGMRNIRLQSVVLVLTLALALSAMSCIEAVRTAFSLTPSVMIHPSRIIPSKLLKPIGRKSHVLFCYNTTRCYFSHRIHFRPPLPRHRRSHVCKNSRLHNIVSQRSPMHNLYSQSFAEQQPSFCSKSNGKSQTNIELSDLSEIIKESYISGETDGVQAALSSENILTKLLANLNAEEVANKLVVAAIDAAGKDRGRLAAMINGILALCCGSEEHNDDANNINPSMLHPRIALAILDLVDGMYSMDAASMVTPDIVALSLVYYSLHQMSNQHDNSNEFEAESRAIVERAQRLAKKMAGSQLRKALAAERRQGSETIGIDSKQVESHLQSLYGTDIHVLSETKDAIVISKPAGIVCYHTKKTTAGKISRKKKRRAGSNNADCSKGGMKQMDISLVDALLDVPVSLSTLNPSARGIVHRLDRGTSGSIVLAKTDELHLKLVALFFLRRVKKKYLALVPGSNTTNNMSGGEGAGSDYRPVPFTMGSTGTINVPVDGRPAHSRYRVVKLFGKQNQSSTPEALLLEVETLTGRKHQVRVHCASLGHPIFLDPMYYSSESNQSKRGKEQKKRGSPYTYNAKNTIPIHPKAISDLLDNSKHKQVQFFLHAVSLSIPELGLSVNAPLPKWWLDVMDHLD